MSEESFIEGWQRSDREEAEKRARQAAKFGDYTGDDCPRCSRQRVVMGDDKKRRCEKCAWCIEDDAPDYEFQFWLTT